MTTVTTLAVALGTLAATPLADRKPGDVILEPKSLTAEGGVKIDADFGTLLVPEDREKNDGRLIEIAFVRLKSTANGLKRAPLFFLEGGPGSPATPGASRPEALAAWLPILAMSDVVLVDQRGTGQSKPNLTFAPGDRRRPTSSGTRRPRSAAP